MGAQGRSFRTIGAARTGTPVAAPQRAAPDPGRVRAVPLVRKLAKNPWCRPRHRRRYWPAGQITRADVEARQPRLATAEPLHAQ